MTMIRRAFIQEGGNGRLGPEERDLIAGLEVRGITAELFTKKKLARRQLPLDRRTLVAGEVPVVIGALRQLGIEPPIPNDYPVSLQPLLYRRVWTSTVRRLINDLYEGSGRTVFAKPSDRLKRFTGHVFASSDDVIYLEGASRSTPIFCAEVVDWVSEYRCYVIRGEIVGIRHYGGNPAVGVDEAVIARAIRNLESAGESTAGYALDFGVLADGRIALVEWNDGFSLGSYGLESGLYADLILARWLELTGD
jgi:ATP-grasp domain, R2K clade family 2